MLILSFLLFRLLALIEQYRAVWLSRYLPAGMQAGFRVRLIIFYM
jgi:hypothetical protein